jgi:hypothetical protein
MGPDGCSGIQASLLENISNMVGILFQTSVEVIEGSNISGRNNEPLNAFRYILCCFSERWKKSSI